MDQETARLLEELEKYKKIVADADERENERIMAALGGYNGTWYIVGTRRGCEYWARQKHLDRRKLLYLCDVYDVDRLLGRRLQTNDRVCWTGERIDHNTMDAIRHYLRIIGWRGKWDEIFDAR